jgi:hypothetical protein
MRACISLACVTALLVPVLAEADVVVLKGGGRVSGRTLSRTDTSVALDVGPGIVTIPMSSVIRIEEQRSTVDEYHERAAAVRAGDAAAWLQLGKWAAGEGLGKQARTAFEHVLAIDPANAEANRALGRVQLDSRWVSLEESYRARGYVQFEGQWMTPAQRAAIAEQRVATRVAELARQDAEYRAREAEARAQEAEARARQAEAAAAPANAGFPLWWAYGGPVWPSHHRRAAPDYAPAPTVPPGSPPLGVPVLGLPPSPVWSLPRPPAVQSPEAASEQPRRQPRARQRNQGLPASRERRPPAPQ